MTTDNSLFPVAITTNRLILREFDSDDVAAVNLYASDPEVTEHHVWGPNTIEDSKIFVHYAIQNQLSNPRSVYEFAIILKANHELIGGCGIHRTNAQKEIADIGYTFSKKMWGQGLATEAAQALIDFGFNQLGVHRIWATCRPENQGSARVLEKCGMMREGYMRKNMLSRGEWKDSLLYAVVK